MTPANVIELALLAVTALGVLWGIRRDMKVDRRQQLDAAIDAARTAAELEDRVHRLEKGEHADDDDA